MNNKEVLKDVADSDMRLIRFLYCDPSGVIRGKTVHSSQFESKLSEGVGLTRAQNAVNLFEELIPVDGMEHFEPKRNRLWQALIERNQL